MLVSRFEFSKASVSEKFGFEVKIILELKLIFSSDGGTWVINCYWMMLENILYYHLNCGEKRFDLI